MDFEQYRNRAFTLKDGGIHQEVDAIRIAIANRAEGVLPSLPLKRVSAVWKFRSARNGTHFFVTSSHLQSDMKGTVHLTEAHFGFNVPITADSRTWVGPLPESRHLHVLKIRELERGEYQHIFAVHIPGFALMPEAQAFDKGKIVTWSDPPPPHVEVTIGLTAVQGDWRDFVHGGDGQVAVGLLTGEAERHAIISFDIRPYDDLPGAVANMQRNLGLIRDGGRPMPDEDLSIVFWMDREPDEPIRMIELHGIRAQPSNA